MPKPVFKNRLKQYITDHNLTDAKAAAGMGLSRDTMYRLVSTDFARLDAKTAHAAMTFFGVPFERLFYVEMIEDGGE